MSKKKQLDSVQTVALLDILKNRFERNMQRHQGLVWSDVENQLKYQLEKLWSLD